jgi:hypothetical protein
MPIVDVGKPLREKLGDNGVESLVSLINQAQAEQKNNTIEFVEEKFERRLTEETIKLDKRITDESARLDKRIIDESARLDKRMSEESARLDKRITEEVAKLDKRITEEVAKLDIKISDAKAEIIKWMFIFWVGQAAVMLGILFVFFK